MKHVAILLLFAACPSPPKKSGGAPPPDIGLKSPDGDRLDVRSGPGSGSASKPDGYSYDYEDPLPTDLHVVGSYPKDLIHKVVRSHYQVFQQCYEQVVMANPGLQGKVIAKFRLMIDGTVQEASATGVHPDLETCVATQIRKFKFPRPDGVKADVEVQYPFTFKPG